MVDRAKEIFRQPNGRSTLKEENNNEIICEDSILFAVGIVMHVLADTWAHDDFSGTSCYVVNNVRFVTQESIQGYDWDVSSFFIAPMTDMELLQSVNSAKYTGHGQINHAPDYDFLTYRYYPRYLCPAKNPAEQINSKMVRIDNRVRFENAFLGMINALRYIKGDMENYKLDDSKYADIAKEVRNCVFTLIPKKSPDEIILDHDDIVSYKSSVWTNYLKNKDLSLSVFNVKNESIASFAHQAKEYRDFMIDYLNSELKRVYGDNPIITFDKDKIERWLHYRLKSLIPN